jgi:hypothetical protein
MGNRVGKIAVAAALLTVVLVTGGSRADAEESPLFSGGQLVAPYAGNLLPSAAPNGTKTLVVWTKRVGTQTDIWGRIEAPDTTTIETAFPIASGSVNQNTPDVAWNGSNWLVVWQATGDMGRGSIRGRRVSGAGALLGSELIVAAGTDKNRPAVAAGPNGQSLVVWTDARNAERALTGIDIYGGRVTAAGAKLDGTGLRLSRDTQAKQSSEDEADVAWNGSTYLVAWREVGVERSQIGATQRRANGTAVTGGYLTPTTALAAEPAVASNGRDFLVVATSSGRSTPADIRGIKVTNAFVRSSFMISTVADDQGSPTVAFNDTYLVAWVDGRAGNGDRDIWAARVTSNGTVLDPHGALFTDFYPTNGSPALSRGSGIGAFTFTWSPTPDGADSGVVSYGVRFVPA